MKTIKRISKFFRDTVKPNESKRDKTIEMISEKHYQKMIDEVIGPEEKYLERENV